MGNIHCFLDGSFPLGTLLFNTNFPIGSLYKRPREPIFSMNIRTAETGTCLAPTVVEMTLLKRRNVRDVARTSTTARELTWYIMRCVKEMQKFWYGQDPQGGARTMGPKWVEALEKKQTQFGRTSHMLHLPFPALSLSRRKAAVGSAGPLMSALDGSSFGGSQRLPGERRADDRKGELKEEDPHPGSHTHHISGDEQMGVHCLRGVAQGARLCGEAGCTCCAPAASNDRGSTRVGTTVKGSEKLGQFLWLIIHIIRPHFAFCEFSASEAKGCLQATQRLIMLGNWLAKTARVELTRFREFMGWLRYGENTYGCIRTRWLIGRGWRVAPGSRYRDCEEFANARPTGSHPASLRRHASE